jgi:hypothetical protein
MRESPVQQRILLACSRGLTRLFRVNTGVAWAGKGKPTQVSKPTQVTLYPGDVLIRSAQPIRMGLVTGGSDLIGWSIVDGQAVFTAIECKGNGGKPTPEQLNFIAQVRAAGGIAGVAYSAEEAQAIIDDYRSSVRS